MQEKPQEITFEDIRPLFGLRLDAPEVTAFLRRFPDHRIGKPEDGAQYVVCRPLGFDLLFMPSTGYQGGRTKQLRVLRTAFLYGEGKDKHRQFPHPPFGMTFTTREDLLTKLGPPVSTSLIGEEQDNRSTVSHWDTWQVEGWGVYVRYAPASQTPTLIQLSHSV